MAQVIDDKIKQPKNAPQSGTPGQGTVASEPKPSTRVGSGFTNLRQIMQANVGSRLGGAVAGGIQGQAQQTKAALQQGQGQFQESAQAGRLGTAQDIQRQQQILQDPTKASEADIKEYERFRAGQYGGPKGIQNISELRAQAAQAQGLGQLTGTQGGRQALLQRYAAAPQTGYTSGKSRLDMLLLGQQGAEQLKQARRGTAGLEGQVLRGQTAAQEQARQYAQEAAGFGEQAKGAVSGQLTDLSTALGKRAETAKTTREAEFGQLQKDIGVPKDLGGYDRYSYSDIDPNVAEALGLKGNEDLYTLDLTKYLQVNPELATRAGVASAEEYAKAKALGRLGGTDVTEKGKDILAELQDESKAGSYYKQPTYVGTEELRQKLQQDLAAGRQQVLKTQDIALRASDAARIQAEKLEQQIRDVEEGRLDPSAIVGRGSDRGFSYNVQAPGVIDYIRKGYTPEVAMKKSAIDVLKTQADSQRALQKEQFAERNKLLEPLGYFRKSRIKNLVNPSK